MPHWTRKKASDRITEDEGYPVAERTLLEWDDVPIVYLNGKACALDTDWIAAARRRLKEELARQGADLPPLVAARRANAARMARRHAKTAA